MKYSISIILPILNEINSLKKTLSVLDRIKVDKEYLVIYSNKLTKNSVKNEIKSLSMQNNIKVLIISSNEPGFSAGHDLGTPENIADQESRPYEEGMRGLYKRSAAQNVTNTLRWRNVPKPTMAIVQGYCIFGGWMIASAMDLIFAADDAMFLGTNFQYFSPPWDIHPRKVKEIFFESSLMQKE